MCIWETRNNSIEDPDQEILLAVLNGRWFANFPSITHWLRAKMPAATFRQSTKFAANRSKRRQNFNGSGSFIRLFRFSHIHGRLFKTLRACMGNGIGCQFWYLQTEDLRIWEINKQKFLNFHEHLDKSVIIRFFHLPSTNTKIISQYRRTYTSVVVCTHINVCETLRKKKFPITII